MSRGDIRRPSHSTSVFSPSSIRYLIQKWPLRSGRISPAFKLLKERASDETRTYSASVLSRINFEMKLLVFAAYRSQEKDIWQHLDEEKDQAHQARSGSLWVAVRGTGGPGTILTSP